MKSSVFFHFGLPKTGTTSLQIFLDQNRNLFEPDIEMRLNVSDEIVRKVGLSTLHYTLKPRKWRKIKLEEGLSELHQSLDRKKKMHLISNEEFSGAMPGHGNVRELFPHINMLLELYEKEFEKFSPTYVFFVRPMSDWKRSVYNQVVKVAGYSHNYNTFLTETSGIVDWSNLIDRVESVVDPTRVKIISLSEVSRKKTLLAEPLLELMTPEVHNLLAHSRQVQKANESIKESAIEFIRRVNGLEMDWKSKKMIRKMVANSIDLFK